MAYLGFHKGGGANFRWPLVLTQGGPNHVFLFFAMVKKVFAEGGHGPMGPLNTPLVLRLLLHEVPVFINWTNLQVVLSHACMEAS